MFEVRVRYPADVDVVLRTSADWAQDLTPRAISADGQERLFRIEADLPHLYFKPLRLEPEGARWAVGANYLCGKAGRTVYPHFDGDSLGRITEKLLVGGRRCVRVYLPPGYDENVLKRYPVLYMLDGANVFFPEEAFSGQDWAVDDAVRQLDAMSLVDKTIVVALYSDPDLRADEYTSPGYEAFGRELVEHVLPDVDRRWRTLTGGLHTAVMGSSLGGVAALHLAWRHPERFGMAGCLSSTFGFRDDLVRRILGEPKPPIRVYLDAGWPEDNHRETLEVFDALCFAGFQPGVDALFLGFPGALHHERAWAQRVHLPIQFFFGRAFRAAERSRRAAGLV